MLGGDPDADLGGGALGQPRQRGAVPVQSQPVVGMQRRREPFETGSQTGPRRAGPRRALVAEHDAPLARVIQVDQIGRQGGGALEQMLVGNFEAEAQYPRQTFDRSHATLGPHAAPRSGMEGVVPSIDRWLNRNEQ